MRRPTTSRSKSGAEAHLRALLGDLSDPAAYPHRASDIQVVQTHTACVFLTGEYAYKVKKPVNLGFLDFSTLERRRHCCEQEVILNRRLCPAVYLDVVPVVPCEGRLRIGAPGEAVEWAVRMRQLPQADMLPARLAAGSVTPVEMARVADVLARFHGAAAAGPEIAAFGAPEQVARNAAENFEQTEELIGEALPAEHWRAIQDYTERILRNERALFLGRLEQGRIRDTHGDLRVQNVCLDSGLEPGVQIFDCIEFNERFRYEDVAADLAYLVMDLDLAGRCDLGDQLVRGYVARSGDATLQTVLRFYQCYRAYVRGKIALLTTAEPEVPAQQRAVELATAAAAFDLARSYAAPGPRPLLIVMAGLSGSGKSTLARELARRLPAVVHASDQVRKEAAGVAPSVRLGEASYSAEPVARVYAELGRRARATLAQGLNTILDATFLSLHERDAAARLGGDGGASVVVLECRCTDAAARSRLQARRRLGTDTSDADLRVYEAQRRQPPLEPGAEAAAWVVIDTDGSPPTLARAAMRRLWEPDTGLD